MATMTCNRVSERDANMAEWAQVIMTLFEAFLSCICQVVPKENNGFSELVKLARSGPALVHIPKAEVCVGL